MMRVNRISQPDAERLIERAFDVWENRSIHPWIQDFGWLRSKVSDYGLTQEDVDKVNGLLSHSS